MIELPEASVIARQIDETLSGKRIVRAIAGASPHKFAWYSGDPAEYNDRLARRVIERSTGVGGNIEIVAGDRTLAISAPVRYHAPSEPRPLKHQLFLEFEDGSAISSSAQMWGGFFCFSPGDPVPFPDFATAWERPSPLTDVFDREYFQTLFDEKTPKLSAKAFLATEQRIPGLGNGVLQDILWTAHVNPKRKMAHLSDAEIEAMYRAVKGVLAEMTALGGRDSERDLFGRAGGYTTVLGTRAVDRPCPVCGSFICKEAYLGGAVYFCPSCQRL